MTRNMMELDIVAYKAKEASNFVEIIIVNRENSCFPSQHYETPNHRYTSPFDKASPLATGCLPCCNAQAFSQFMGTAMLSAAFYGQFWAPTDHHQIRMCPPRLSALILVLQMAALRITILQFCYPIHQNIIIHAFFHRLQHLVLLFPYAGCR